jgi:CHASE1-domain containing sensor protein
MSKKKTRFGAMVAIVATIIGGFVGLANLRPHVVTWLSLPERIDEKTQRIEQKVDVLTSEVKSVREVLLRNQLATETLTSSKQLWETMIVSTNTADVEGYQ